MMAQPSDYAPEQPAFTEAQINRILALPPAQRVARLVSHAAAGVRQLPQSAQRAAAQRPHRGLNPAQKEVTLALEGPQRVVNEELAAQRLTRDIYSNCPVTGSDDRLLAQSLQRLSP
jgi:hypothetical protein